MSPRSQETTTKPGSAGTHGSPPGSRFWPSRLNISTSRSPPMRIACLSDSSSRVPVIMPSRTLMRSVSS